MELFETAWGHCQHGTIFNGGTLSSPMNFLAKFRLHVDLKALTLRSIVDFVLFGGRSLTFFRRSREQTDLHLRDSSRDCGVADRSGRIFRVL